MDEHVDVVVVGAGLGGLAAAVTTAGPGRRVLVLERSGNPGGYAQCFQRGVFRFDASLHALSGLEPGAQGYGLMRDLGIRDRVAFRRLDPIHVSRFPGLDVVAHADPIRYEADLIARFPHEAAGIRTLLDEAFAAHREARRLGADRSSGREAAPDEFLAQYPALVRLSGETFAQTMDRHVQDPRLQAALGSLWLYLGLPPSRWSAVVAATAIAAYHFHGAWYPEGGSGAVSRALVDVLRERGGEIRLGDAVTAFEVDGGRVRAVTTASGSRITADVVISNANAPATMLDLVGRAHLPDDYVARVTGPALSYTTVAVYLGLDRDVVAEAGLAHEVFLFAGFDHDAAHQAALAGDWAQAPLTITDYGAIDPSCAPPGGSAVVLTAGAPWDFERVWGTDGDLTDYHLNPRHRAVKEAVADQLVARAADHVPGLVAAIRHREVSTPLSNFAYTGNPHGAIEGYENSPENSGAGWLPQTTPIANLFLAGAWTNSGGQVPALASGAAAARLALRRAPVPVA